MSKPPSAESFNDVCPLSTPMVARPGQGTWTPSPAHSCIVRIRPTRTRKRCALARPTSGPHRILQAVGYVHIHRNVIQKVNSVPQLLLTIGAATCDLPFQWENILRLHPKVTPACARPLLTLAKMAKESWLYDIGCKVSVS